MRFNPKATALVAVALLGLGATGADAQAWPARPVRIIVPFAPGGTADTLGRLVRQRLRETFQENLVDDDRARARRADGSQLPADAPPPAHPHLLAGPARPR